MSKYHHDLVGSEAFHDIMYVQSSDPGAVGAFKFWLDTTASANLQGGAVLKQRNPANSSWTTRADLTSLTGAVSSVFGRTGAVVAAEADYTLDKLGDVTITSATDGNLIIRRSGTFINDVLGASDIPNLAASKITSGTIDTARLGSGSATSSTFLRGDQAWATPSAGTPTFSGCKLTHSSNQSISSNTATTLNFDTETYDTDGFHESVTHPDRITIPSDGYYRLTAFIEWATSTSQDIRGVSIFRNGTTTKESGANVTPPGTNSSAWLVGCSVTVHAVATDFFIVRAFQVSSGALNVNSTSPYSPTFEIERIGV